MDMETGHLMDVKLMKVMILKIMLHVSVIILLVFLYSWLVKDTHQLISLHFAYNITGCVTNN